MKVLLMFGGQSYEHEISCMSLRNIYLNIDKEKYDVSVCGIDKEGIWYIVNDIESVNGSWNLFSTKIDNISSYLKSFDIVFPVMNGFPLESGDIIGLFNTLGVKYVGSGSIENGISYDKEVTKLLTSTKGINVTPYKVVFNEKEIDNLDIDYPVIIKPSKCGSSIGIYKCNNYEELKNSIKESFKYDNKVLIEKFIHAKELECGVLIDKASIVGEIIPHNEFYDYDSKYVLDSNILIPADINESLMNEIRETSLKIFKILGLKDIARIDYLYDIDNKILYFSEINTMPGFTDISMYTKLFNHMGISTKEIIDKLINGK